MMDNEGNMQRPSFLITIISVGCAGFLIGSQYGRSQINSPSPDLLTQALPFKKGETVPTDFWTVSPKITRGHQIRSRCEPTMEFGTTGIALKINGVWHMIDTTHDGDSGIVVGGVARSCDFVININLCRLSDKNACSLGEGFPGVVYEQDDEGTWHEKRS